MSTAPRQPSIVSNDVDDFVQAGLYPGGTGIVEDIEYKLWDYDGKRPPDSQLAVRMIFQPTDGSNEGKLLDNLYFSVGPASDFQPSQDGGFVFAVGSSAQLRQNSNWHFFATKLRDNCGLERGKLNGPSGIKILKGTQLTLTRVDQPHRDIAEDAAAPGAPHMQGQQQRTRKPTILIPTAAVFSWDKGTAARRPAARAAAPAPTPTPAPMPAQTAAAAPVPASAPSPAPAAAPVNGSASGIPGDRDSLITEVLRELLSETPGNMLEVAKLPSAMIEKIGPAGRGIAVSARMEILKQVKDTAYIQSLAAANGWTTDGAILSL